MSQLTLKRASGFFAAGREVEQALALLSDGAFKLFVFLCLYAERRSGRLRFRQSDLARRLDKSPRSITTYLQELQRHGVCEVWCL
jgi:DNA-binding HxlR family transcriptional regulator